MEQSLPPILYAYDGSGSTCYAAAYHAISKRLLNEIEASGAPFRIIHWESRWREITPAELRQINNNISGCGGTRIECIAEAIGKFALTGAKLVLLTDGEVPSESVERCDQLLRSAGAGAGLFSSAEVHIVSHEPNLSVSCPFTRHCPHRVVLYDPNDGADAEGAVATEELVVSAADIETLATIDGIATFAEFEASYDAILRALRARQMGRGEIDTKLHDQVTRLRGRLVAAAAANGTNDATQLIEALGAGDGEAAIGHYRDAVVSFYQFATDFERSIGALLNITAGGLKNDFSHRLRRADTLTDPNLDDIAPAGTPAPDQDPDTDEVPPAFVCPILLEDESDVAILVREGPPLLSAAGDALEDLITCPLNALNRPELCAAIAARLDIAIGLSAIKASDRLAPVPCLVQSPYTREPITGALYLGANDSQARATDTTIARLLLSGGAGESAGARRVGNMDLWAAVLWRIVADRATPAAARLADENGVLAALEAHMRWRLSARTTYASLSGLSGYYNARVPLGVACWMVAAAPLLKLPAKRDVTRLHAFHLRPIYDLVRLGGFGATLPFAELDRYRARIVCLYRCLAWAKKGVVPRPTDAARALYQRAVRIQCAPYWVPIDGPADAEQIAAVRAEHFAGPDWDALSEAEIVATVGQAARAGGVAAGAIEMPFGASMPSMPAAVVQWPAYGLSTRTQRVVVPICPATVRPYYTTPLGTWKESVAAAYNVTAPNCLSANERYVRFTERFGRFPETTDEFIAYLYQSYGGGGGADRDAGTATLPAPIVQFAEETLESYAPLIAAGMTPTEFTARAKRSQPTDRRIVMEKEHGDE